MTPDGHTVMSEKSDDVRRELRHFYKLDFTLPAMRLIEPPPMTQLSASLIRERWHHHQ
jgi:hypothetical protein